MKSGRLDRRITIEQYTVTRDSYGGEPKSWSTWATVWAEKRDKKGREYLEQSGEHTERETVFKIRYQDGLSTDMRILCDGRYYDIIGLAELGRREGWEVITEAQQP